MERTAADFEAQEAYGRRVIVRSGCRHRLPCGDAIEHNGVWCHIDGLTFDDEAAAQRFDRRRLERRRAGFRTFPDWEAARAWLTAPD